jgi:hypothetical protein
MDDGGGVLAESETSLASGVRRRTRRQGGAGRPFAKGNTLGRRFQPGESGNPVGFSKAKSSALRVLEMNVVEAAEKLIAIMQGEVDPRTAHLEFQAVTAILDRVLGKPKQQVDVEATYVPKGEGLARISALIDRAARARDQEMRTSGELGSSSSCRSEGVPKWREGF